LDTPKSGAVRIIKDDGTTLRVEYSSWEANLFRIDYNFLLNPVTLDQTLYITYIDKLAQKSCESFSVPFIKPRDLIIRVRNPEVDRFFETHSTLDQHGGIIELPPPPTRFYGNYYGQ
jgi:hypothetical protein